MASLYQRGDVWWAKFRQGGKVIRVSTGTTSKKAAKDFLDIHAGKIAEGLPLPVKLDLVLYDELRKDLDSHYQVKGIRSLVDAQRRMRYLDTAFRGWRAVNITESAIETYVAKRLQDTVPAGGRCKPGAVETTGRKVAAATINRELAQLRKLLRLAYERRKLAHVPKVTLLPEAQPRQGFVEEPEFQAIVKHLEPDAALAATMAFDTAWRIRSEILTLTWDRVDVAEGCIRLDGAHSKNGRPRTAYLTPGAIEMLAAQRARVETLQKQLGRIIPEAFVHLGKGKLQGQPIRGFKKAWKAACRKAGYPHLVLHDLRRSGIRAMVRSGTPDSVAMRISGHATRAVFLRYDITSDADLKEAAARRAQFGHSQRAKVVALSR